MVGKMRFTSCKPLSVVLALALLAVAGCGETPDSATDASAESAAVAEARRNAAAQTEDMVAAVPIGKPGAPIEVRFDLPTKPVLGEPLKINVAVVPVTAVARLEVVFQGSDGLDIVANGVIGPLDNPKTGAVIRHEVIVLPKRDGVATLSAVAMTDGEDSSASRSFAIPVIVGASSPVQSKPAGVAADATGEVVQSLPAVENSP